MDASSKIHWRRWSEHPPTLPGIYLKRRRGDATDIRIVTVQVGGILDDGTEWLEWGPHCWVPEGPVVLWPHSDVEYAGPFLKLITDRRFVRPGDEAPQ